MYANTAYEALYQLMGLQFQEQVTGWITSEVMFRALITIIFAVSFFGFLLHFASKYIPFAVSVHRAPISRVVLLVFCLFIGISLLKVGAAQTSSQMGGKSWSANPYVTSLTPSVKDQYRVSLIFRVLSGSAEEIARGLGFLVDKTFAQTNSQMTAPNYFFKAMLGAAAETIDDPSLKGAIQTYTENCLSKALPTLNSQSMSDLFSQSGNASDTLLAQIEVPSPDMGPAINCLDMKTNLNRDMGAYAHSRSSISQEVLNSGGNLGLWKVFPPKVYDNFEVSNLLVNEYLGQREGSLGVQKGAEVPGTGGRITQFIESVFSVQGITTLFGAQGVTTAASRSMELSAHLARAPHVAGFIKMLLVGFFPVLVFFLAAGRWRPVLWWWLTYLSICLWTPLWALLYHIITTLSLNAETMNQLGQLGDGVSLYAASLITSRLYQAFAVYSYLQLLIGPLFTGLLLTCMKPMLRDTESDGIPDGIGTAGGIASGVATKVATGGIL